MSTVGYATLQIIPSIRNISGAISGGLGGIDAVGRRAGAQIGDGIAAGVEAKKAAVDKAAAKVATARGKEEDAAGRVRVAEAQLQELRDKGITEGARLTAAEERVAAARRKSTSATGAARSAASDLEGAQRRLADSSEDVADSASQMEGAFDGIGEQAAGAASGLGKMAVAAAGVGSAMEIASSAMDFQQVTAKMNASLGATGALAADYGRAAGDLYKSGLGESMGDAAEAVKAVSTSFTTLGSEGEVSLQKAGERAMNFANTFDQDVSSAVQTASLLVTDGLAADSTQAFDLMTTAFQRVPAAMQEELPEILQEYGTNFRALGFEGDDAFNLLVAASTKGKFALDKTGDALKEFTIRGSDMSQASQDAFTAVGLDAEQMANKIAAGGPGAQAALQSTAKGLLKIKDPAELANSAIALFGTPLEDLSVDQIPQFLSALTGGENAMAGFEGSTDKMGKTLNDTAQSKLTGFTRGLQTGVIDTLGKTIGFIQENAGLFRDLGVAAGIAGGALALMAGPQLLTWIKTVVTSTKLWSIAQAALNLVMSANPLVKAAMLIAALVGAIVIAYRNSETFRNIVQAAWRGVQSVVSGVVTWFKDTAWPMLQGAFQKIGEIAMWLYNNVILPAWNGIKTAIGIAWAIIKGYFTVWMTVFKIAGTVVMWLWNNVISPAFAAIGAIIGAVWNGIIKPIWNAFTLGLQVLGKVVMWLWNNVFSPAFTAIGAIIGAVWNGVVKPVIDAIKAGFSAIGDVLNWVWNSVIKPVWDFIGRKIDETKIVIGFAIDVMKQHFQSIADKVGEVKDWIVDKWNAVVSFFTGVKDKIASAASGMWDGIKDAFKGVINWVIRAWNSLEFTIPSVTVFGKKVGGATLSVPKLQELASGGTIAGRTKDGAFWGPGTGTSDSLVGVDARGVPIVRVAAGEGVVTEESMAHGGAPVVAALNAGWVPSASFLHGMVPGLAAGGTIGGDKKYQTPPDLDGGTVQLGDISGPGITTDIQQSMWDAARREFPDAVLASATRTVQTEGHADFHNAGQAIDFGGPQAVFQKIAAWIAKTFPNSLELINSPFDHNIKSGQDVGDGYGFYGAGTMDGHTDHTHWAMDDVIWPDEQAADPAVPEALTPTGPSTPPAATPDSTTPETAETTETKQTPARMKSFKELGQDAGGILAEGIGETFGLPSWIMDPSSAIAADDGSNVRTTGDGASPQTTTPQAPAAPEAGAPAQADRPEGWMGYVYDIARKALDMNLPKKAAVIGTGTSLVEAGDPIKMWANNAVPESLDFPHDGVSSDHDSIGIFQQRANGWGTVAQRMSALDSAGMFYDALTKLPDWESMDLGAAAQAVQRSAFPERYAQVMPRAEDLVDDVKLFDTGGQWNPGELGFNGLKEPEMVLRQSHWNSVDDQTSAVRELVGAGARGDTNITVHGLTAGDIVNEIDRHQWRGSRGYGSRHR